MVKVYFEGKGTTEWVATFADDSTYIDCYPILEQKMKEYRWENIVESVWEDVTDTENPI